MAIDQFKIDNQLYDVGASASNVSFDNSGTDLSSSNLQTALVEVNSKIVENTAKSNRDAASYVTRDTDELENYYTIKQTNSLLDKKQDTLTFDKAPTENSNNLVKSGDIYSAIVEKADASLLSQVATSGNYNDLNNTPQLTLVAFTNSYNSLQDKPNLANVALSGSYEDLINTPALEKVATSGNYNDLNNTPIYARIATTGSYNDLNDRPAFAAVASSGNYNDLSDRPTLATVATSGNYTDLMGKPTLSDVVLNLPATPQNDGEYVLKCTVINGAPTFSWVLN